MYGLIGVGLVVIYRGSRTINFAYGETGMLGAFLFVELWTDHGISMALALPAAVGLSAALGAATEVAVARPLREDSRLSVMVGTFGIATLLLVFASRRWGVNPRFIEPLVGGTGWRIAGLTVAPAQLLVLAVAAAAIAALTLVQRGTSFGLRLRATAIDPYAAGQVGIDVDRTSLATWALAGGLSGLSAILIAPLVSFHVFFMTALLVRGIAAALVGGLTSLWGAFAAGTMLGIAEGLIGFLSPIGGMAEASLALFIIAILVVRPSGLIRSSY